MLILTNLLRFLITSYLGCTQRGRKPNEIIIVEYTKMFESRISVGATGNYLGGKKLTQQQWRGPTIRKDMRKNALRDV